MPRALRRPCLHPGCAALTDSGRCAAHARETQTAYDKQRGSSAQRGYGARWRKLRAMILARDPVCTCPGLEGCDHAPGECMRFSAEADHLVPKREGGDDCEANLGGKCKPCHSRKTAREDGRWG